MSETNPPFESAEMALQRARAALEDRERELTLIYTSVADAIFSVDVVSEDEFRFNSVNRAFLQATGLLESQVIGGRVEEVLPEPSRSLMLQAYRRACRERQTVRWEETRELPAGVKIGEVSVTPIHDDAGRCIKLIGAVHDVTERRRADELNLRLAAVVESSDDAIVSKTLQGVISTWNEGAQRMFGYTADEVVGKPILVLIPLDRQHEEPQILAKIGRGERIEHYETVRQRKDGTLIHVSLTVSPVKDKDGRVIGVSKIARDITERVRTEHARAEESRSLELLNSAAAALGSTLDRQTLVQRITDVGRDLTGAKFGAFFYNVMNEQGEAYLLYTLSGAPREAFDKFGLPRNTPIFQPTFSGEAVVRLDDVTKDPRYGTMAPHHGHPKGHLPVRSYLAVPVITTTGEVMGGLFYGHPEVGVFTERSERLIVGMARQAAIAIDNARLYEEAQAAAQERTKLLEAERAARGEAERVSLSKDEFLATLSHELRTPLNAILGWAEVLRSWNGDVEELKEGMEVIERNSRVQAQLIEDLLDMSRIISGKLRLDVQRVDLQDVMKAAVASVRHSAEAKGIRLQVVLDPLAGPVRGDPNRLQQCVWNLLSNAIKFTPRGGRIEVALQRVNSHLEVCVTDNGAGIKPEFLPHVFERFRQSDSSTTRRHGGLGLGLAIVKSLTELHGGTVRARSAGEGKGSTFCIELPMMIIHTSEDAGRHPSSGSDSTSMDLPTLAGITVLAIDDEPDARHLLKRVLEDQGAKVLLAASADEGFAVLQRERPDLILSDIGMPGRDGYDLIRQIRALPAEAGGRTPAAALTAFARTEDRTRALRAGYQIHVSKPVSAAELTAVVASLVGR